MAIFDATITTDNRIKDETFTPQQQRGLHPAVSFGLAAAFLAHGAILLSLPPVLRQRGAPFLPTASKGLNTMFQEIKKQPVVISGMKTKKKLYFFDLGSGDGRVVFRAAREGIFFKSIGVEINPGENEGAWGWGVTVCGTLCYIGH
jgi:Histone methylation protein DOT1.